MAPHKHNRRRTCLLPLLFLVEKNARPTGIYNGQRPTLGRNYESNRLRLILFTKLCYSPRWILISSGRSDLQFSTNCWLNIFCGDHHDVSSLFFVEKKWNFAIFNTNWISISQSILAWKYWVVIHWLQGFNWINEIWQFAQPFASTDFGQLIRIANTTVCKQLNAILIALQFHKSQYRREVNIKAEYYTLHRTYFKNIQLLSQCAVLLFKICYVHMFKAVAPVLCRWKGPINLLLVLKTTQSHWNWISIFFVFLFLDI